MIDEDRQESQSPEYIDTGVPLFELVLGHSFTNILSCKVNCASGLDGKRLAWAVVIDNVDIRQKLRLR